MINVIHINVHFDDDRKITAIDVKLKLIKNNDEDESNQYMVTTICKAFYNTTLLADVGKSLNISVNPNRQNIVNLSVKLKENDMSLKDIANFNDAFQQALDATSS